MRGWSGVDNVFKRFAKDCRHMSLISRADNVSSAGVTYRYACACSNTIQCPWQFKVIVPMDQSWAALQYMKVDPDACSGDQTVTLDHRRYCRQTMFAVNKEVRHVFHANHVCIISVGNSGHRELVSVLLGCREQQKLLWAPVNHQLWSWAVETKKICHDL